MRRILLILIGLGLWLPAPADARRHHHVRHHHHHIRAHRADDEELELTEEELIQEIQWLRQECLAEGIETQEWCENLG